MQIITLESSDVMKFILKLVLIIYKVFALKDSALRRQGLKTAAAMYENIINVHSYVTNW